MAVLGLCLIPLPCRGEGLYAPTKYRNSFVISLPNIKAAVTENNQADISESPELRINNNDHNTS